jgi:hypothetical protein
MDTARFDGVSRFLSQRLNRRQAGMGAVAFSTAATMGLAIKANAAAQESATPAASADDPGTVAKPLTGSTLFVQSFQGGSATGGAATDEFTVNLEGGLGQTIYFSDRPQRLVGTLPTEEFLAKLGFFPENPPNAALIVEQEDGDSVFAVVELFNPAYDTEQANLTYDVKVLDEWTSIDMQFQHGAADFEGSSAAFGTAHLLIDGVADCPDATMECIGPNGDVVGTIDNSEHDGYCYNWANIACMPCEPGGTPDPFYFVNICNERYDACEGDCGLWNFCSRDAPTGNTLCQHSDAAY